MIDEAVKIIAALGEVAKSKSVQKAVLGTYSDGNPRSVADALEGEIYSPKQKAKFDEKVKKKKKKVKKNRKKNGGRAKLVL